MSKKSKQISRLVKSRILSESHIPGCSIPDLAKAHGISAGTIYRWHREKQKLAMVKTRNKSETHSATPMVGNFVELSVCDHEEAEVSSSQSEESLSVNCNELLTPYC